MTAQGERVLAFGGRHLRVAWEGADARGAVDLLSDATASGAPEPPPATLTVTTVVRDGELHASLTLRDERLYAGPSLGAAAHHFLQHALRHLIESCDGGLVFHAALVGHDAGGILLPGPSGSGKSMLAAWMAGRGFVPLSDEACFLSRRATSLEPFPRPFCFKGDWAEALGLDDGMAAWRAGDVSIVPRARIAAGALQPTEPVAIVFPRFVPEHGYVLEPLSAARAAVRLLESVVNARNLPHHGIDHVASLARATPAYALTYGQFDQLPPFLETIASTKAARRA